MNWNTIKGNWKQFTGHVRQEWGKFTDDDMEQIKGERDKLVGAVQLKYGETKEAAEKQVDQWMNSPKMKKAMANFDEAKKDIEEKIHAVSEKDGSKSKAETDKKAKTAKGEKPEKAH